ncbi:MAG: hypothetical protein ACK5MP_03675 [Nostocoides sp.]
MSALDAGEDEAVPMSPPLTGDDVVDRAVAQLAQAPQTGGDGEPNPGELDLVLESGEALHRVLVARLGDLDS